MQLFDTLEAQYGLPRGYLGRTAQIESGGNPNAQNPNSSAGGLFQFIDSTAAAYGLTNKNDPEASADAAARLARDNMQALRSALGRSPTAGELYLAHQQGAGGAIKLLSNPQARAIDVLGNDALNLNGGSAGMSAADFARKWTGKFGGAQPSEKGSFAPYQPQNTLAQGTSFNPEAQQNALAVQQQQPLINQLDPRAFALQQQPRNRLAYT